MKNHKKVILCAIALMFALCLTVYATILFSIQKVGNWHINRSYELEVNGVFEWRLNQSQTLTKDFNVRNIGNNATKVYYSLAENTTEYGFDCDLINGTYLERNATAYFSIALTDIWMDVDAEYEGVFSFWIQSY